MRQQASLGLKVAAVFLVLIVGLPLFNQYFPEAAATPVFGFPFTWLFLGVAFFPITWILSAYFVRESDRIESEAAQAVTSVRSGAGVSSAIETTPTASADGATVDEESR